MESPRVAHPGFLVDGREEAVSWDEPGRQGADHIDGLPPILTMDQLQNQLRMRQASDRSQLASIAPATMGDLSQNNWDVTSPAAPAAAAPHAGVSVQAPLNQAMLDDEMLTCIFWRPSLRIWLIAIACLPLALCEGRRCFPL